MVNELVQCLQRISAFGCFEILLKQHFLELLDGPVEHSDSNLIWLDIAREVALQIWMPCFERLLHDVVLV